LRPLAAIKVPGTRDAQGALVFGVPLVLQDGDMALCGTKMWSYGSGLALVRCFDLIGENNIPPKWKVVRGRNRHRHGERHGRTSDRSCNFALRSKWLNVAV
jgi:hypothetical protein